MNNIFLQLLPLIIAQMSAPLHEELVRLIDELEKRAKISPGPWDNLAVQVLKFTTSIP